MSQTRLNPFTRWFLIALSLFAAALLIYAGQTLSRSLKGHPLPVSISANQFIHEVLPAKVDP